MCLTAGTGSGDRGNPWFTICQFPLCNDWFQATEVKTLTARLGRAMHGLLSAAGRSWLQLTILRANPFTSLKFHFCICRMRRIWGWWDQGRYYYVWTPLVSCEVPYPYIFIIFISLSKMPFFNLLVIPNVSWAVSRSSQKEKAKKAGKLPVLLSAFGLYLTGTHRARTCFFAFFTSGFGIRWQNAVVVLCLG